MYNTAALLMLYEVEDVGLCVGRDPTACLTGDRASCVAVASTQWSATMSQCCESCPECGEGRYCPEYWT